MTDVREINEIALTIPNRRHREAFFASHGLDMERVEKNLPTLQRLEGLWHARIGNNETAEPISKTTWKFGPWNISVWKDPDC